MYVVAVEIRHRTAYGSANIGGIANKKFMPVNHIVIPFYGIVFQRYCRCQMVRVIQQNDFGTHKITNKV